MSSDLRSDVTALVLSVGEAYTQRALDSVQRQVPAVADVVVVRDIAPFHRALNVGAQRVHTPFFIQVDADMIIDDTGCAELRRCATDAVGTVVGHLRDPLLGRIVGVKLFRTACFDRAQLPDSVSADTDFIAQIERSGWLTVYALKYAVDSSAHRHAFGEHRPEYTPLYTFSKFVIEGARLRYRRVGRAARHLFRRLHASPHAAARFALIGAAHGIFLESQGDLQRPFGRTEEVVFLEELLAHATAADVPAALRDIAPDNVRHAFDVAYRCGIALRRQQAGSALLAGIDHLAHDQGVAAWAALVGLCHGIFVEVHDEARASQAFLLLNELLTT